MYFDWSVTCKEDDLDLTRFERLQELDYSSRTDGASCCRAWFVFFTVANTKFGSFSTTSMGRYESTSCSSDIFRTMICTKEWWKTHGKFVGKEKKRTWEPRTSDHDYYSFNLENPRVWPRDVVASRRNSRSTWTLWFIGKCTFISNFEPMYNVLYKAGTSGCLSMLPRKKSSTLDKIVKYVAL